MNACSVIARNYRAKAMRIRKDHSPQRTGEFISERLEQIEALRPREQ